MARRICRSYGACDFGGPGFYKYVAPLALGAERARLSPGGANGRQQGQGNDCQRNELLGFHSPDHHSSDESERNGALGRAVGATVSALATQRETVARVSKGVTYAIIKN